MSTPRRSDRRGFLTGQSALDAVEDLADQIAPTEADSHDRLGRSGDGVVVTFSRSAMACEFHVGLNARQHARGAEAAIECLDLVDRLEDQLTVYRDHSEVSRLNQTASQLPIRVEARLFRLLRKATEIARDTGGAYDPTTGALSKVWGFYRRQGRMPSPKEVDQALATVGWQDLEFDAEQSTIRYRKPGMEINLGGIGKGHALDRCVESMLAEAVDDFVIHGGHSSVVARGSRAGRREDRPGWLIGLRHPLQPDERLAEFLLKDQALGTSGSGTQFFHHQGKRYAHILDPRTGRPAEGVLSATVIAPTAAEADALSTAFFVMGVEQAQAYCRARPAISALLVVPTPRGSIDLVAIQLADSQWQRLA